MFFRVGCRALLLELEILAGMRSISQVSSAVPTKPSVLSACLTPANPQITTKHLCLDDIGTVQGLGLRNCKATT